MTMRTVPEPSTDEGKRVHQELRGLLETTAVQQSQSSTERWHLEANFIHISLALSTPKGNHAPSMLWLGDGGTTRRREPS
jgi:hypothetical protein